MHGTILLSCDSSSENACVAYSLEPWQISFLVETKVLLLCEAIAICVEY